MSLQRLRNQFFAVLFSRFPGLTKRWLQKQEIAEYGPPPWTPVRKSLSASTVAVVTTAGVHLKEDAPFNMHDQQGDPTYRVIPHNIPRDRLCITHDYYDHRDADKDLNIVFPLDRLEELSAEGMIGAAAPFHYSFMGHIDGPYVPRLLADTAPQVAQRLKQEQVDAVLLTPA